MKPCLNLGECYGLGDLLCATPVIKQLSLAYDSKVIVISPMPELFKNNPFVEKSYKASSMDMDFFNANFIMHNSFYNIGKKNERGIEMHHNKFDIRQFHAANLGFMLSKDEMECIYYPIEEPVNFFKNKYVAIHPVETWAVRTWNAEKWMQLTSMLNKLNIDVVSIGKDSHETGFFDINKPVMNFEIEKGKNLMNKTTISECWHIINNAACFVTMDSGLLHLAGTTDTNIIHLGSSITPEFRMPYRNGSQNYKYAYVAGSCSLQCASALKYGVKEWGDINSIPPLIACLEKKETFECHPSVLEVCSNIIRCI